MMKRIMAITVAHASQRYPTVGDYTDQHGCTLFSISEMGNEKYEYLVLVHELIEKILVDARGISHQSIDDFDIQFETDRDPGDESEPGHDTRSPYRREHVFAERIERLLADELGVDWDDYDKVVGAL